MTARERRKEWELITNAMRKQIRRSVMDMPAMQPAEMEKFIESARLLQALEREVRVQNAEIYKAIERAKRIFEE